MKHLQFRNTFTSTLPADPVTENRRRQVSRAAFSRVAPTPVAAPELVAWSREMADILDLSPDDVASDAFTQVFAGNGLLDGMDPFAMCYGGHQFGNWAGQLGDGRAINLGEVVNTRGERWVLQLKGAGPTPYSRTADGLAVLRSSIREFLCSEAMHHLGVPTTRALSIVTTGEQVIRDMFYDGNPRPEPGAVVCRVAPSFLRFGNYQIFTARRETEELKQLVDYTLRHDFPHLGDPSRDTILAWYREVCERTADLMVEWMRVGFVHGVMNTDNMSILGLTIDYGPYGWLEDFDPDWTPNTTDAQGRRYRYGYQPQIAQWNLMQLGQAIYPLIEDVAPLQEVLDEYPKRYDAGWNAMMARKLGIATPEGKADADLFADLVETLQLTETDMTLFYRSLADVPVTGPAANEIRDADRVEPLLHVYYKPDELTEEVRGRIGTWLRRYSDRIRREGTPDADRRAMMNAVNPKYVLRNYLAQTAIDLSEQGDHNRVRELLDVLRRPYDDQPEKDEFAAKRPEWARHRAGCSMLSCSS